MLITLILKRFCSPRSTNFYRHTEALSGMSASLIAFWFSTGAFLCHWGAAKETEPQKRGKISHAADKI